MVNWVAGLSSGVAGLAVLIVILGYYLENIPVEKEEVILRMAASYEEKREEFKKMSKSAFILGYTGEVGKELVRELVSSKVFARVVLIGRREVKFEDESYKNLEQRVIDFEKIEEHADAFSGFDVGFCCLGTTRAKAGAKGFYRVDHDYIMNAAKLAKDAGLEQFHLVSSVAANKNSWFLYPKTKGEVEEELKELHFPKLAIYQPGLLLCDRTESRTVEKLAIGFVRQFAKAFPTAGSVPTSTVAKAMLHAAVTLGDKEDAVKTFSNKAIHYLAGKTQKAGSDEDKAADAAAADAAAKTGSQSGDT